MKEKSVVEGFCKECNKPLGQHAPYSLNSILCSSCKIGFISRNRKPTRQEILLYNILKTRNIPSTLYYDDGYKTIDLVVKESKVHIEIDGKDHHNSTTALSDLKRSYHSMKNGYVTLRIPNSLIDHLDSEGIKYIEGFLAARRNSLKRDTKLRQHIFSENKKTG